MQPACLFLPCTVSFRFLVRNNIFDFFRFRTAVNFARYRGYDDGGGYMNEKITFSNHHRKYFVLHIRLYIVNILLNKSSLQPKQIKTHVFSALHYFQTEFYCIAQFLSVQESTDLKHKIKFTEKIYWCIRILKI